MNYKNIVAIVVCGLLSVGDIGAMDRLEKKDPGIRAIELANRYFMGTPAQKKKTAETLGQFLAREDYSHKKWGRFTGDLPMEFQRWDEHGDEKVQKFKRHLYVSYYAEKTTEFICDVLKDTLQKFCGVGDRQQLQDLKKSYQRDILILLGLLSKKMPYKKERIMVAISLLFSPEDNCNFLYKAVEAVCEDEESAEKQGEEVLSNQPLLTEEKEQPMERRQVSEQELRTIVSRVLASKISPEGAPQPVGQQQPLKAPGIAEQQEQADQPGVLGRMWSGLTNIVSTGISWIWQGLSRIFGGFFSG